MALNPVPGFGADGKPLSHEVAKKAIDKICLDRGHIDDCLKNELTKVSADLRTSHYSQAETLRRVHAKFTKTIAEQLYSSKSRLIYELLQNADDCTFPPNVEPSVTFRVHPSYLIVDSNETGFTHANVQAVCSTGESSKVGESDTTGEKGFGFKSVFSIAHRVHIQSGKWSFEFRHKHGSDGVGMVTPIWRDPDSPLSTNIGTRCKLEFSDKSDSFIRYLVTEFEKLPNILVFALRKLRKVTIIFEGVQGRSDQIVFERHGDFTTGEVRIATIVNGRFGGHETGETKFRVFQTTCRDMPAHELRYTTSSTVTIAFQVGANGIPVIPKRGQYVFAYLPVQPLLQLPFLVQADFILLASREAIPENDWNNSLLHSVAKAFEDAVMKICKESCSESNLLSTRWMRYIPTLPMEGFWEPLFDEISTLLKSACILQNMNGTLRQISNVRVLPSWFLHDGRPLLPDTEENIYLSSVYKSTDIEIMKKLGLSELSLTEILVRLKKCLSGKKGNLVHSKKIEDDFHTAFANLLLRMLQSTTTKKEVSALKIIPLTDGQWISPLAASKDAVYLPFLVDEGSVQIEIPQNLGINKLHLSASAVGERRQLYTVLGISTCNTELVVKKILEVHQKYHVGSLDDLRQHFEVLFWFGKPDSAANTDTELRLSASTSGNKVYNAQQIFFPSEDRYNAQQLLVNTPESQLESNRLGFLHPSYMNSKVRDTKRFGTDWPTWLQNRGISYYPPLTTTDDFDKSLSSAMKLVISHNVEKLVPALKAHWSEYKTDAPAVAYEMGNVSVPCYDNILRPLAITFIPTEEIITQAQTLEVMSYLPFLKLPGSASSVNADEWSFLEVFHVIGKVDSHFYLAVLRILRDTEVSSSIRAKISTKLYAGVAENSRLGDAAMLLNMFKTESLIYAGKGSEMGWFKPAECVWSGPEFLTSISVLSTVHSTEPAAVKLFRDFLNIRDVNHLEIIKELEELSKHKCLDEVQTLRMPKLYAALAELAVPGIVLRQICDMVVNRSLIYVEGRWLKPSQCVWNCSISIAGRKPLNEIYPDLRNFFVGKMGVTTMNANVLARELLRASEAKKPNINETKQIFIALGQQLTADKTKALSVEVVNCLTAAAFIPVRFPNGEQQLEKLDADFCINDHKRYGEAFRGLITMIDFDHEEVTSLSLLFKLLNLEDRYLSGKVRGNTIVDCSEESEELTVHFKNRVYGLSCCAVKFDSPKYSNRNCTTHELLTNTKIFICDQMWTELSINEPGPGKTDVKVKSDRAVVKLERTNDALHIFVPSDEEGLSSCFSTEMPSMLVDFLGIENDKAERIIYRLLTDEKKDLPAIMEIEDISDYSWIEKPSLQQVSQLPIRNAVHKPALIDKSSNVAEYGKQAHIQGEVITLETHQTQDLRVLPPPPSFEPVISAPVWEKATRKKQYKKLLQEIVRQARNVPSSKGSSLSSPQNGIVLKDTQKLPDYESFRSVFRGTNPSIPEESNPMGAAGELFVFERLLSLGVANFSLKNWQSSIRSEVNVLPGYEDMRAWPGHEVSDIMYEGDCTILRKFLTQNTSHPYPPWLDDQNLSNVQYHIEIKTTPGPCDNALYMSQYQYTLMKEKANQPSQSSPPEHLYVIVRVFNLITSKIGMEVYINPWNLKDDVLQFVADPWKVIPKI